MDLTSHFILSGALVCIWLCCCGYQHHGEWMDQKMLVGHIVPLILPLCAQGLYWWFVQQLNYLLGFPFPSCLCDQGVILEYTYTKGLVLLPMLRVFRILRLPKLIPRARGLRLMILTLYWAMPAFGNFFTVFFLFMSIYVRWDHMYNVCNNNGSQYL